MMHALDLFLAGVVWVIFGLTVLMIALMLLGVRRHK